MRVYRTTAELLDARRQLTREQADTLALVPTMGALHEGHLAHLDAAKAAGAQTLWVSVFVNPTQFGPGEDFRAYPRPLEKDLEACAAAGAHAVFAPASADELYPPGEPEAVIDIPEVSRGLEGDHRPGHFQGVCRVVAKLLGLARPALVTFGRKDYQQLCICSALVDALGLPIEVVPVETVREDDGLAMSSRNVYLSPEARPKAAAIHRALLEAQSDAQRGMEPRAIEGNLRASIDAAGLKTDYAELRRPWSLEPVREPAGDAVALVTARLEEVRLLDNLDLSFPATRA
ncbi:MAG: pantoate--beta-alanine ligase [Planctomycetota bacterium]